MTIENLVIKQLPKLKNKYFYRIDFEAKVLNISKEFVGFTDIIVEKSFGWNDQFLGDINLDEWITKIKNDANEYLAKEK